MNDFQDDVLNYIKLLVFKCYGTKDQLRSPIYKYFSFSKISLTELDDLTDELIIKFGKEITKFRITYNKTSRELVRKNYDTGEVFYIDGYYIYQIIDIIKQI